MNKIYKDVLEFHKVFNRFVGDKPSFPSKEQVDLRIDLVKEETNELEEGINNNDLVKVADSIIDSIYVLVGMGIAFGLPLEQLWDEIHQSNLSKTGGEVRKDGKILKGLNYFPPRIGKILLEATTHEI